MVATQTFHELVNRARLFMKKASWGCCVLVFDSSGEPAGHPDFGDALLRVAPGLSLRLGARHARTVLAPVHAPMDYESSMYCSTCCVRGDLGQSHLCSFSGPIEVPRVEFGEGDLVPSLGAVHFVCRSCQRGCHVVNARRGLG